MNILNDKQMLDQLKLQEEDLLTKLKAIQKLIAAYSDPSEIIDKSKNKHIDDRIRYDKYDENATWAEKIMFALQQINEGYVNDIVEFIVKQEPNLARNKAKRMVTLVASRLYRGKIKDKKIKANTSGRRFKYYI